MSMKPKERVHIDHETGIVSVWHHGVRRPVVHSESGEHCRPVAVDIRAAIAEAVADARADVLKRCEQAIEDLRRCSSNRDSQIYYRDALVAIAIREPPSESEPVIEEATTYSGYTDAFEHGVADENKRCCEAIRAACECCDGDGQHDWPDGEVLDCTHCEWPIAAIRNPPAKSDDGQSREDG